MRSRTERSGLVHSDMFLCEEPALATAWRKRDIQRGFMRRRRLLPSEGLNKQRGLSRCTRCTSDNGKLPWSCMINPRRLSPRSSKLPGRLVPKHLLASWVLSVPWNIGMSPRPLAALRMAWHPRKKPRDVDRKLAAQIALQINDSLETVFFARTCDRAVSHEGQRTSPHFPVPVGRMT